MASSDTTVGQHHKEKMAHNYPEGAKHHSPGQGPESAARRTVALGSMRRRHISQEIRAAIHRDLAEAEIIPRRDCVLDNAPVMGDAFHSDEDTCDWLIQGGANLRCASVGSALGYDVNGPLGRFHRLRRLRGPLESLTKRMYE